MWPLTLAAVAVGFTALTRRQVGGRGCRLSPAAQWPCVTAADGIGVGYLAPVLFFYESGSHRDGVWRSGPWGRSGAWVLARCHAGDSGPGEGLAELGRPNVLGPGIRSEQGCPRLGPPFPVKEDGCRGAVARRGGAR